MKLKLTIVALFLALTTSAFAQFFVANPSVTVLPGQVTAEVFNPYPRPIICSGQVFGQTIQGPVFSSFFAQQLMYPGNYRYAFVVTNGFNPFVGGFARINCRFF